MKSSSHPWIILFALPFIAVLTACSGGGNSNEGNSITFPPEPFDPLYPANADNYEGQGDNTIGSATLIQLGEIQDRTLWPIGDIDYVRVELSAGIPYEFAVNQLCVPCDTYLSLYAADGITQLATNDDHLGLDSRIRYTPALDGTYYLKIESFKEVFRLSDPTLLPTPAQGEQKGDDYGVSAYTLSAHTFTDEDRDGASTYYDCNDNDPTVYPWAEEIAGDGISQNCSGIDQLLTSTADAYEPDNDSATAKPLFMTNMGLWEVQHQERAWRQNARTIDQPGETDYFTFTLAPWQGAYLNMHQGTYPVFLQLSLYDSDGTTLLNSISNDWPTMWVANSSNTDKIFYASYHAADGISTAWYVPALYSAGVDYDGDGYYTRDWGSVRDCNDRNANIHPGAVEQTGDGVDTNCNGDENV